MFVGEFDRSVDGNGRLALPSQFRDELGDRCYVTMDPEGFVAITTVTEFEREAADLREKVRTGEVPRSVLRDFGVNSTVVSIDRQGRITLDEPTRRHAGIGEGTQAKLAGSINVLEVWRPSRFRTIRGENTHERPFRAWDDEEDVA